MRNLSPKYRSRSGTSTVEIVVAIFAAIFVLGVVIPVISGGSSIKCSPFHPISDFRQIQMAMDMMNRDNETLGQPIVWTCVDDTPMAYEDWKKLLVDAGYLQASDMEHLLTTRSLVSNTKIEDAYNVFALTAKDPGSTLLFSTKNWKGIHSQELSGEPAGEKLFAVMKKDGSGAILKAKDATNAKLIGDGGRCGYLSLK